MALEDMLERYGIGGISQMTPEIYNQPIAALKQTKPRNRRMGGLRHHRMRRDENGGDSGAAVTQRQQGEGARERKYIFPLAPFLHLMKDERTYQDPNDYKKEERDNERGKNGEQ